MRWAWEVRTGRRRATGREKCHAGWKKLLAALLGEKQGEGGGHRPEGRNLHGSRRAAIKKRTRTSRDSTGPHSGFPSGGRGPVFGCTAW